MYVGVDSGMRRDNPVNIAKPLKVLDLQMSTGEAAARLVARSCALGVGRLHCR
jgi:hypothetical protein